jgi:hypothetical protein
MPPAPTAWTPPSCSAASGSAPDMADVRVAVLVEGDSDRLAVESLARRTGPDLASVGVCVVVMGGATNASRVVRDMLDAQVATLAGLCDEREAPHVAKALVRAGLAPPNTSVDLAAHGFFLCVADLEDELIRSLGVPAVERLLAAQGDLARFRTLQQQPAHRGRSEGAQLRRFLGSQGGRKIHYAPLLVEALQLDRIPVPLVSLLAAVHARLTAAPLSPDR